jgi:hypothetical protein
VDIDDFDAFAAAYQPDFDGITYDHDRDHSRLTTMLTRVQAIMTDDGWHTLAELAERTGGSEAAVSARLRDLRKRKFGGHTVERRYLHDGLWEYRYIPRDARERQDA